MVPKNDSLTKANLLEMTLDGHRWLSIHVQNIQFDGVNFMAERCSPEDCPEAKQQKVFRRTPARFKHLDQKRIDGIWGDLRKLYQKGESLPLKVARRVCRKWDTSEATVYKVHAEKHRLQKGV